MSTEAKGTVVRTARIIYVLAGATWLMIAPAAVGQRVQFATPVETAPAATRAPAAASPASAYPSVAAPPLMPAPGPTTFAQPGTTLGTPGSGVITPPPGAVVGPAGAAPAAAVQPPPAAWDPFATPGVGSGTLLTQDPCLPASSATMATMQKFLQHIEFNYDWFAGHGKKELGINDLNLDATFAFPMFFSTATPLLVTPGFAVHYWEGPVSVRPVAPGDPAPADMPPRTYDAYLDFAWNPQVTEFFGGELSFRTGVFSDFYRVTSDSIRFMGKGMGVVKLSPNMSLKAGVWYLDRVRVKILPAGGLVWTPTPDLYFNILFPNPRFGKRLTTWGNTEWWIYGAGEYGGGTWTIRRDTGFVPPVPTDGTYTQVDYNDIRIALGLEFKTIRQWEGYFEVGLSCSRELVYADRSPPAYYPNNTVYLGAGLTY